ncbi:MAG: hypothetical protein HUN04_13650 [Desulfobacter sp.]|nr:MAG: hypothetical protein HUN04_13650 [Desulfobacter sp.]
MGKILKGQKVENPYKDIFFGKDKNRSDFLILIVFFGAILMIFKGPMIIVNVLFAEKFNEFIASSGSVMIIFSIISVFAFSLYKISIYAAIASLKYFNNEVIDSFKTGIKGIWNFKVFVVLLFLFEFAAAVIIQVQTPILVIIVNLSYYIIPAVLMTFMISKYWLDENIEHSAE